MSKLLIATVVLLLSGCMVGPPRADRFDGMRVVIEGRWNALAKEIGQIVCTTEPKIVDVRNIDERPTPSHNEIIRVTAELHWHGPAPDQRDDVQAIPVGYYINWSEAKWEKLSANAPVPPPNPK
jgi:hypothetical protein